jgi:arginine/lysine/ornithine decarboxylase
MIPMSTMVRAAVCVTPSHHMTLLGTAMTSMVPNKNMSHKDVTHERVACSCSR